MLSFRLASRPLQTPPTVPFAAYSNLQDKTCLHDGTAALATLAILPDSSPFPLAGGPDALQKGGESPLYAKLGSAEADWRASGIVHDFNNQLAIILSHCSIALNKLAPDSTARQNLERAVRATKRAADLSSQLQMVTEEGTEKTLAISLNELVRETVELLAPRLTPIAQVELTLQPSLTLVNVSPPLIQRVMLNLLLNAIQASPESKGQIQIATENLSIPPLSRQSGAPNLPPGDYVSFQISDNGMGMNQETLNQIFEPYFTTKVTGMGLGLTAALRIVQAHRGLILVWSALDQGTTFRVLLPVPATT